MNRPTKVYDHIRKYDSVKGDYRPIGGGTPLIGSAGAAMIGILIGAVLLFNYIEWRSYEMKDAVKCLTVIFGSPIAITYICTQHER